VSTKNTLESESVKKTQQTMTSALELSILKQLIQKNVEDAILSNECETLNLKKDISNERMLSIKNLDNKDLINQELIEMIEQINHESANVECLAEKAAYGKESQTIKYQEQLNKEKKIVKDSFKKCEDEWNNKYSYMERKLEVYLNAIFFDNMI